MLRQLGRQPGLDGVRAVAIVSVMGLHAVDRLFPGGYLGVDVFFVLSAFLITTLILAELDGRDGQYSFRDFYARRALRLGPALLLWLFLIALPTAIVLGEAEHSLPWIAGSLLYVGNFMALAGIDGGLPYVHVWSLAIEEQFYALWPLILVLLWRYGRGKSNGRWVTGAVLLALLVQILAGNYFLITGHILPLGLGAACAWAFARCRPDQVDRIVGSPAGALGALALIPILVCGYDVLLPVGAMTVQVATAIATAYLILHVCTARPATLAKRVLTLPPVLWLGRRSYGLYLYHRTLAILVPELVPGIKLTVAGPLVLVLSFLIAEASFRWVEHPVQQWGRRRLHAAEIR